MGYLVVNLCPLGANTGLLCIDTGLLRIDALHLCSDALVLFGQRSVLAGYLFFCGGKLLLQHLNLIIYVIHLLPCDSSVSQQFGETLPFTLLIGNLLTDGRYLPRQIQPAACRRLPVGGKLPSVCFELSMGSLELVVVRSQLVTLQDKLPGVNLSYCRPVLELLSFGDIECYQLSGRLCRHGYLRGFERPRSVVILPVSTAGCHHKGKCG